MVHSMKMCLLVSFSLHIENVGLVEMPTEFRHCFVGSLLWNTNQQKNLILFGH